MKTYYLHTLNDKPAVFVKEYVKGNDKGNICYVSFYGKANELAIDLKQIRREQKISKEWDKKYKCEFKYDYIRVCVPKPAYRN